MVSMKRDRIYICWTYHHLLVAMVKTLVMCQKADLMIVFHNNVIDKSIVQRISDKNIFQNVYVFNEDMVPWDIPKARVIKYIKSRYFELKKYFKENMPIDLTNYKDIYTFFDSSSIGVYLHISKIYYHIIEDAKKSFTKSVLQYIAPLIRNQVYNPSKSISFLQKIGYIPPIFGTSKYCIDIEVDSLDDLYFTKKNRRKFVCVPEKNYFSMINNDDVHLISEIFAPRLDIDLSKRYILLLTEPLAQDNRVQSMEEQLKVYQKVIEKIDTDVTVLIKPHPRDICDYNQLVGKSILFLPRTFPSEILSMMPNECFVHYYAIATSAIYSFPEDKRTIFGNELLKEIE